MTDPPYLYEPYVGTRLRAPTRPLVLLPHTLTDPTRGSVLVAESPAGTWGPCFAYPASLPPATIMDNFAGNVTAAFTAITVPIGDPPVDYRVYYILNMSPGTVGGTTKTLTINGVAAARRSGAAIRASA